MCKWSLTVGGGPPPQVVEGPVARGLSLLFADSGQIY